MKKYLKIEFGSRGEMLVEGIVESSLELLEKENLEFLENCEEDDKDYFEEFMYVEEYEEEGLISVGKSEEESYVYIDCEKNKDVVDRLLELDRLMEEDSDNSREYDIEFGDIIGSLNF